MTPSSRDRGPRVTAVVVTHDRLPLLKGCIAALKGQARRPDALLVVDNGSTDGTKEWLERQRGLRVFRQGNLGGSGGFHRGLLEAYRGGADWFWIMDDDAHPTKTALTSYLQALKGLPPGRMEKVCLAPVRLWKEGERTADCGALVMDMSSSWKIVHFRKGHQFHRKELASAKGRLFEIQDFSFEGPLLPRRAVEDVGLPCRDFFLWQDDSEYCQRLKKAGYRFFLVSSVRVKKRGVPRLPNSPVSENFKYYLRNSAWLHRLHGRNPLVRHLRPLLHTGGMLAKRILLGRYWGRGSLLLTHLRYLIWGLWGPLPRTGKGADRG